MNVPVKYPMKRWMGLPSEKYIAGLIARGEIRVMSEVRRLPSREYIAGLVEAGEIRVAPALTEAELRRLLQRNGNNGNRREQYLRRRERLYRQGLTANGTQRKHGYPVRITQGGKHERE